MRYRLQRHDGTDCSATMVPFTVLRLVPIQRYCHRYPATGKTYSLYKVDISQWCHSDSAHNAGHKDNRAVHPHNRIGHGKDLSVTCRPQVLPVYATR